MKISYLLLFVAAIISSCTNVKPSEKITKQSKDITGISSIDVSNAFEVHVNISDNEGVEIETNENLQRYIKVEKQGDKLVIQLEDNISVSDDATFKVYVSAKMINELKASGACSFIVRDTLVCEKLNVELSGASSCKAKINCDKVNVDLSGASSMSLAGTANLFNADASGASDIKAFGLTSQNLKADISGASLINITVDKTLDVIASGASSINYKGKGKVVSEDVIGASEINKK